jgi:hypothetical protein
VQKIESFLVQQFFKNAAEVKGEKPLSLPAGSETLCATLRWNIFNELTYEN